MVVSVVSSEGTLRPVGGMLVPQTTARLFVEAVAHGESRGPWLDLTYGSGLKNGLWGGDTRMEEGARYLLLLRHDATQRHQIVASHSVRGVLALDPARRLPTSATMGNYWAMACGFPLDVPQVSLSAFR